jgi:hypothetical protein
MGCNCDENECSNQESDCNCEHNEELSIGDLAKTNNFMLNGLIEALIKKGILSEAELTKSLQELQSKIHNINEKNPEE